jgi:hypothetical protein
MQMKCLMVKHDSETGKFHAVFNRKWLPPFSDLESLVGMARENGIERIFLTQDGESKFADILVGETVPLRFERLIWDGVIREFNRDGAIRERQEERK